MEPVVEVRANENFVARTPIVVTLVHGTFAKGAPWTRDGSVLRQQVAANLGEHERDVHFDVFEWSGRNAHKARIKAGYQLADHIRALRRKFPHCRHFIVAHSHGGNVALYAHSHLPQELHALGVATLGTPFLHAMLPDDLASATEETLRADRREGVVISMLGWMLALVTAVMTGVFVNAFIAEWTSWSPLIALVIGWFAWSLLIDPLTRALAWLTFPFSPRRAAMKLGQALTLKPMERTHILSFIYPGDEAGLLLSVLEQTTALPTKAVAWFKPVAFAVGGLILPAAFVSGFLAVPVTELTGIDPDRYDTWAKNALTGVMLAGIYIWLFLVTARYVLSFLRGHPGGFGWERPSIHAHVQIGARPTAAVPAAKSNAHQDVPFTAEEDAKRGLRHSGLYEDPRILKALAYWMAHVR